VGEFLLVISTITMLIVFVLAIIGLINPQWVKMPSRGKSSTIFFSATFILFIISGVTASSLNESKSSDIPISSDLIDSHTNDRSPNDEDKFINVVEKYSNKFHQAKNELQQSLLRDQRKQELSIFLNSLYVKNWIGTINQLSTNSEGKAILSIRISPNIEIKTWNNALSDIMEKTLIDKGTPIYKTLTPLSTGQKIKFSGSFFSSSDDYIKETSMTIRGSMKNPEFLFKFYSVELFK
jgi:hypothetical protein